MGCGSSTNGVLTNYKPSLIWYASKDAIIAYNISTKSVSTFKSELPPLLPVHYTIINCIDKAFIFGGETEGAIVNAAFYIASDKLEAITEMNVPTYYYAHCCLKEKIILIGGKSPDICMDCKEFNANTFEWKMLPKLNEPRYNSSGINVNGVIYAICGLTAGGLQGSIEKLSYFSPSSEWVILPLENYNLKIERPLLYCCRSTIYIIDNESVNGFNYEQKSIEKLEKLKNYEGWDTSLQIRDTLYFARSCKMYNVCEKSGLVIESM